MKTLFTFLLICWSMVTFTLTSSAQVQPGYSVIASSKAQFLSDVWINGQLKPQKAITLPKYTTTQRNNIASPAEAMFIYNTTLDAVQVYTNGSWVSTSTGGQALWTLTSGNLAPPAFTSLSIGDSLSINIANENVYLSAFAEDGDASFAVSNSSGATAAITYNNADGDPITRLLLDSIELSISNQGNKLQMGTFTLNGLGYDVIGQATTVIDGDWVGYYLNGTIDGSAPQNSTEFINSVTNQSIGTGLTTEHISIGYTSDVLNATAANSANLYIDTAGNMFLNHFDETKITFTDTNLLLRGKTATATLNTNGLIVPPFASEPTGQNGAIYYNTVSNKMRVYEAGAWRDL